MHSLITALSLLCSEPQAVSASPIKAVIFDCDGVLVDSEWVKFQAWQLAFEECGIVLTLDEYQPYCGYIGSYVFQKICDAKKIEKPTKVHEAKRVILKRLQSQGVIPIVPANDYLHKLLEGKPQSGLKIALASSASRKEINHNLQALGLSDAFDVVLSGENDLAEYEDPQGTNKPKPYIYQKAARLLGLLPQECLVFEDTRAGVLAASGAGCVVVAVPNRLTSVQDFSEADFVIESFEALLKDTVEMAR